MTDKLSPELTALADELETKLAAVSERQRWLFWKYLEERQLEGSNTTNPLRYFLSRIRNLYSPRGETV